MNSPSANDRDTILMRDQHRCIACEQPADTISPLLDLRLWDEPSFDPNNWVTLCLTHAATAEDGALDLDYLRLLANIQTSHVPPQCYPTFRYDRWGNQILQTGLRVRGELFYAPDVQAILIEKAQMGGFVQWAKYPRTFLLPWVKEKSDGDRVMLNTEALHGQRVIVTEKMDGENITIYNNYFHGRSVDGPSHPSRDWLKSLLQELSTRIPNGVRICGEYLFARHTITYDKLDSYFLGFSAWTDRDECLPWDDTLTLFQKIGIRAVPLLYDGLFNQKEIHAAWQRQCSVQSEGYIIRSATAITPARFRHLCGKFIRSGYTQTDSIKLNIQKGIPIVSNGLYLPRVS